MVWQLPDHFPKFIFVYASLAWKGNTKSHNDMNWIVNNIVLTWYGDVHGTSSPGVLHLTCEVATYNGGEVGADNGE